MSDAYRLTHLDGAMGGAMGEYCHDCADEVWADMIRHQLDTRYFDAEGQIYRLKQIIDLPPMWFDPDTVLVGVACDKCGDVLSEARAICDGCGREAPDESDEFTGPVEFDKDGRPHYGWCTLCELDVRFDSELLLADDGRGYRLRVMYDFVGYMNYDHNFVTEPTVAYVAGCRRFDAETALRHWGSKQHYTRASPEYNVENPAEKLFNAVLRHAMRQALPRLAPRPTDR